MSSRTGEGPISMVLGVVALSLTLWLAGCQIVTDPSSRYASEAHVELTGGSGAPLLLVSSTEWGFEINELTGEQRIAVLKADTTEVDLPYKRSVPLTKTYRILFRLISPTKSEPSAVRMRVRLDEKEVYDQSANLNDGEIEFSFFYQ